MENQEHYPESSIAAVEMLTGVTFLAFVGLAAWGVTKLYDRYLTEKESDEQDRQPATQTA